LNESARKETTESNLGERKMRPCRKTVMLVIGISIFTGGLLAGRPAQSADLKIGCVDMRKAVNECNEGKVSKKALAKEAENFQRLVAEKQKGLQEMKDSLEKQGLMLNADARAEKAKELQTKVREFQRWGEDRENEIKQKGMEMQKNISIGLIKVVQKLGADEGYTIIVETNENIVLFDSKSIDITDRVIKAYDAQRK
jgi:outer membrane protein